MQTHDKISAHCTCVCPIDANEFYANKFTEPSLGPDPSFLGEEEQCLCPWPDPSFLGEEDQCLCPWPDPSFLEEEDQCLCPWPDPGFLETTGIWVTHDR